MSLLLFALLWVGTSAQNGWLPPKSNKLVNDYASILSPQQVHSLEQRLVAFSDSTSNQILVIITPTLGGDDENAVAQRIGQTWGVGQKEFDNGVVILLKSKSADENFGAVAIATGYGVEGVLPDIFCKRIIDDAMLPPLRQGNYHSAIVAALDIIEPVLAGEYSYAQYRKKSNAAPLWGLAAFLGIIAIGLLLIWRYAKKHPDEFNNKGGKGGGGHNGGIFFFPGFGGGRGNNFGGGSFGGGGFGGFGGGGFGGGGASGRF